MDERLAQESMERRARLVAEEADAIYENLAEKDWGGAPALEFLKALAQGGYFN